MKSGDYALLVDWVNPPWPVDFIDYGFELQGFAIHQDGNKRWIYLPAKPPTDPQQNNWIKMMKFYDRRAETKFTKQVLLEYDKFIRLKEHITFDD